MSAVGTLLAALLGVLCALPAAGRVGGALRQVARFALNVLRSVPELVWAALMVLAAGLGPFAGALALALHTTGVLGRLFAEALENAPPAAETALREAGAGSALAFALRHAALVWPQFIAYGLYRWEMNIRMAAVLGFVGAGGLGQMLYFHLSIFQQAAGGDRADRHAAAGARRRCPEPPAARPAGELIVRAGRARRIHFLVA